MVLLKCRNSDTYNRKEYPQFDGLSAPLMLPPTAIAILLTQPCTQVSLMLCFAWICPLFSFGYPTCEFIAFVLLALIWHISYTAHRSNAPIFFRIVSAFTLGIRVWQIPSAFADWTFHGVIGS